MKRVVYPFSAIVGQEKMKKALILNIINPSIGGVLIKGEKGTAKSTAVRALVNLLPEQLVVAGCRYNCSPLSEVLCPECKLISEKLSEKKVMKVVDLPIGATEDRVVGTLDIEHALKHGEKKFEPGILASANRNVLYVDEINLLDDHIVDILLDSAAMGENIVEREGVSYNHPAKFVLVGTMNPEEGDLRPQLLDRFGLTVEVIGERDIEDRVSVIKRRMAFEENREVFVESYQSSDHKLSKDIEAAKHLLNTVSILDDLLSLIAEISIELGVDGHRADITMLKTAKTLAAYNHRTDVNRDDIFEAAELVLPHRMRRNPFDKSGLSKDALKRWVNEGQHE
jgi:Mg-chelatase subunit ChlI